MFSLKMKFSLVVLIGFYTDLFVGADPEQERNTELVPTDEEEDEEQCEGGAKPRKREVEAEHEAEECNEPRW